VGDIRQLTAGWVVRRRSGGRRERRAGAGLGGHRGAPTSPSNVPDQAIAAHEARNGAAGRPQCLPATLAPVEDLTDGWMKRRSRLGALMGPTQSGTEDI
jgi:hypothetical protein